MNLFEKRTAYQTGKLDKPAYISEMHKLHQTLFEYAEFIRDTDIASIEITDGKVVMTSRSHNIKIIADQVDERLVPIEIINFGKYEGFESSIIYKLIDGDYNIFDIGANIGWYSLNLAKAFPSAHLFSFEPIPHTYNYLKTNIELNQFKNIAPYNWGFSDQAGDAYFYYYPEGSGNASAVDLSGRDSVQKVPCLLRRLDDFADELNERVDFIKCDTEGSEWFVFKGGINTLKHWKPIVFTELLRKWSSKFNYHPNQVIDFFSELGYLCFVAKDQHLVKFDRVDEDTVETNFFFLHAHKHAAQINRLVVK